MSWYFKALKSAHFSSLCKNMFCSCSAYVLGNLLSRPPWCISESIMANTLDCYGSQTCCFVRIQKSLDSTAKTAQGSSSRLMVPGFELLSKPPSFWTDGTVMGRDAGPLATSTRFFHLCSVVFLCLLWLIHIMHRPSSFLQVRAQLMSVVWLSPSAYVCTTFIKPSSLSL